MAHIVIMPRQGNTVESCIIGEWKVKEGDAVQADTPVCVVETDKATFEVTAGEAGTVLKILHPAGDDVPVLQPILALGKPGERWEPEAGGGEKPPAPPASPTEETIRCEAQEPHEQKSCEVEAGSVSPRARKLAAEEAVDLRGLAGTGPGGRIIARDVEAAAQARGPLTGAAREELRRRFAAGEPAEAGPGTGIGGRISAADLKAPAAGIAAAAVADEWTDTPIKGIRKVISDQMMASHSTTAAFTLNASAQAVNLQALRARFKASDPALGLAKVTVNDLVLFAASRALPLYPYMNAHKLDGVVRQFKSVHLGVAVSTPRGLMVPVLRNADKLSLSQISEQARELAGACRNGTIKPEDLHGSTLTVTNLGNTGIESFSPVINIPEVAILGVCGISLKPLEVDGECRFAPHLGFSLTIDHAVVDGAPAAEFLKAICAAIRDIDVWLAK